jgi:hypothetical protein
VTEEIIWKDPPKVIGGNVTGGAGVWVKRLSPLLDRPTRWALVATTPSSSTAANLRRGLYKIPSGQWQFRTHQTRDGHEIYARYLGPTEEGE